MILRTYRTGWIFSATLVLSFLGMPACTPSATKQENAAPAQTQVRVPAPRIMPDTEWPQEKEKLRELGKQHATASELYQYFKMQAAGGTRLTRTTTPDWSGWWTAADGFTMDPDQPLAVPESGGGNAVSMPTAKMKPEYEAKVRERIRLLRDERIQIDPRLHNCLPPGYPRFLVEPWGREFIVTVDQSWLISELGNEVHRVYTDGRDHLAEADRQPLYDGDTIGFWDGDALVTHTNQLTSGVYQVTQPDHSAKLESVEIWRKVADDKIMLHVWFYDPVVFEEPWFVRRSYIKDANTDKQLRLHYYDCVGGEINAVKETPDAPASFIH